MRFCGVTLVVATVGIQASIGKIEYSKRVKKGGKTEYTFQIGISPLDG